MNKVIKMGEDKKNKNNFDFVGVWRNFTFIGVVVIIILALLYKFGIIWNH